MLCNQNYYRYQQAKVEGKIIHANKTTCLDATRDTLGIFIQSTNNRQMINAKMSVYSGIGGRNICIRATTHIRVGQEIFASVGNSYKQLQLSPEILIASSLTSYCMTTRNRYRRDVPLFPRKNKRRIVNQEEKKEEEDDDMSIESPEIYPEAPIPVYKRPRFDFSNIDFEREIHALSRQPVLSFMRSLSAPSSLSI